MTRIKRNSPLLFVFCVIAVFSMACSDIGGNSTAKQTAADEAKVKQEQEKAEREKAIADFITTNYKGFELKGIAGTLSEGCEDSNPCDLHLTTGTENKVVTVTIKKFQRSDGTSYWFVYESTKLELARYRIKQMKEASEEDGREFLANGAEVDGHEDYDSYEPRY